MIATRRAPWIAALTVAGATAAGLAAVPQALACSCVPPPPDAQALRDSDAVFSGRVLSRAADPTAGVTHPVRFTIAVEHVAKGPRSVRLVVTTSDSSASCGIDLKLNARYLVFASASDGQLGVSLCSGTREIPAGNPFPFAPAGPVPFGLRGEIATACYTRALLPTGSATETPIRRLARLRLVRDAFLTPTLAKIRAVVLREPSAEGRRLLALGADLSSRINSALAKVGAGADPAAVVDAGLVGAEQALDARLAALSPGCAPSEGPPITVLQRLRRAVALAVEVPLARAGRQTPALTARAPQVAADVRALRAAVARMNARRATGYDLLVNRQITDEARVIAVRLDRAVAASRRGDVAAARAALLTADGRVQRFVAATIAGVPLGQASAALARAAEECGV